MIVNCKHSLRKLSRQQTDAIFIFPRKLGLSFLANCPTEGSGNILLWRLIMKYFLWSFFPFCWFKMGSCQFLAKERMKPAQEKMWWGKLTLMDWLSLKILTQMRPFAWKLEPCSLGKMRKAHFKMLSPESVTSILIVKPYSRQNLSCF